MKRCLYRSCSVEFLPSRSGQLYCSARCERRENEETHDQDTIVDIDPIEPVRAPRRKESKA